VQQVVHAANTSDVAHAVLEFRDVAGIVELAAENDRAMFGGDVQLALRHVPIAEQLAFDALAQRLVVRDVSGARDEMDDLVRHAVGVGGGASPHAAHGSTHAAHARDRLVTQHVAAASATLGIEHIRQQTRAGAADGAEPDRLAAAETLFTGEHRKVHRHTSAHAILLHTQIQVLAAAKSVPISRRGGSTWTWMRDVHRGLVAERYQIATNAGRVKHRMGTFSAVRAGHVKQAVDESTGLEASQLTTILERLTAGVIVVNQTGRPILVNETARRLLGRGIMHAPSLVQGAVSAGMRHAHTGRLVSPSSTPVARALRGETVLDEELMLPRGRDEQALRFRVTGIPLLDEDGTITGAVSVFTDVTAEHRTAARITRLLEAEQRARAETEQALAALEQELVERKRAEAALEQELAERKRTEAALQGSQQRLRLALEASHMGTWDYDIQADRMEWSEEMAAILGAPPDTLSGDLAHGLGYVHPEQRAEIERSVHDAIEGHHKLQLEARMVDENKRVRWLMVQGRVYRDEHGTPLRMTGIAMDVTERKDAEAARQALAQTERLRALGQMASGIAHDLNQSLALISGYSDMARQELQLDVPDAGRVREMVEITARAALEGGQALKGLLSFARTQELMAESEWIDVGEVVRDAARLTAPRWRDAPQAEGRPISLDLQVEPECAMHGSPAALREAITNLIFNAVDALPHGGTIRLVAARTEEHAIVEVSDTGTGMTPEVKSRVFDPFFTTKGERGTGLGLPQVVAIVERHAGSIELESAPGQGTTFRLRFPRVTDRMVSDEEVAEHAPQAASKRPVHILVVEDEVQLARMAGLVLTQRGHHVTVAASGEEALERLANERFELVISDLGLGPGKNGWDVADEVRRRWPGTRFVLVTGWGAAIDPKEARVRGVDEVIAKPYRIADLRQIADHVAEQPDTE